jgi:hypothetical protein
VAVATIVDYVGGLVLPDTPEMGLPAVLAPAAMLAGFRRDYYRCLNARADALFELTEAQCRGVLTFAQPNADSHKEAQRGTPT